MDLVVFDLDGTLLNKQQNITPYTQDTLAMLREKGIAYTVATGRTRHAAIPCLADVQFELPHVYKNGALVWQPETEDYSHKSLLNQAQISAILDEFSEQKITPFVFTLDEDGRPAVFHSDLQSEACHDFHKELTVRRGVKVQPLSSLPSDLCITNISALGATEGAAAIHRELESHPHMMSYFGGSIYNSDYAWIDIHHSTASKGSALEMLKTQLGVEHLVCFGDSDNDLSMFAMADEGYAPANALAEVKAVATEVIDHHDDDGIARFLRERFSLT